MYLVSLICVFCLGVVSANRHMPIHERMTAEQVQKVFRTTDKNLPRYSLVDIEVSKVRKRDLRVSKQLVIRGHGNDINLDLTLSDGVVAGPNTPVVLVSGSSKNISFSYDSKVMQKVGKLMHDPNSGASIIVSKRDSGTGYAFNGYLRAHNLVLRALPEELIGENEHLNVTHSSHVLFAHKLPSVFHENDVGLNTTRLQSQLTRHRRATQNTLYIESLVLVDYSSYRALNQDIVKLIQHYVILFNDVDLVYKKLNNPKIRINVARIFITTDPNSEPYITQSLINKKKTTRTRRASKTPFIDARSTSKLTNEFLYQNKKYAPLDSYDVSFTMTPYRLMSGKINAAGIAAAVGACTDYPRWKTTARNGILRTDTNDYPTLVLAHEFGHLLNAVHDESTRCPKIRYNVMTSSHRVIVVPDEHLWEFSVCSIESIRNFTNEDTTNCLKNSPPNIGKPFEIPLPGKLVSYAEQCAKMGYKLGYCDKKHSPLLDPAKYCLQTRCRTKSGCTPKRRVLLDGTPCDDKSMHCLQGKCVKAK